MRVSLDLRACRRLGACRWLSARGQPGANGQPGARGPLARLRGRAALAATHVVLALLAACAHGDTFEQGTLRKGDLTVHVGPLPTSWRRVQVDGADLAFRDEAHDGSALFDVRCGREDDDAPLGILTEHLIMGTTDREIESQETLPFDGREAMHTLLRAKLDGVPMRYDLYVMKKDGCVYDIVYVAAPDRFAAGAEEFERFARGVHALSSSREALGRRTSAPSEDP